MIQNIYIFVESLSKIISMNNLTKFPEQGVGSRNAPSGFLMVTVMITFALVLSL